MPPPSPAFNSRTASARSNSARCSKAPAAGCVWFDYNNDGLPDLYVVSGKPLEEGMHPYPLKQPPAVAPHNHLYRNNGDGTFTDVTDQAGVAANIYGMAAIAADFDNDGFVDLFVTGYGRAILYRNNGDGTFEDVTAKAGIKVDGWSISSAWLDYDRDGCVDLFVGRYVKFDPKYRNYYAADNYPGPLDYAADTNRLYHNNCNGTFTDVTDKSGIGAYKGRTMGVTAADFDGDGYPDIYVANDKTENFLFHNKHDGTFEEIAADLGVAYGQNGENTSAMGPVFADIDGDGRMDLWVTDSKYNRLMRNTGKNGFEDIGPSSGISQATAQYTSWGTGVYDFDNDGWLDILIFHGGLIHLVPQEQSLFRGLGNGKFADVSREAGPALDVKTVSRGACFADYDNDGKDRCLRREPGRARHAAAQRHPKQQSLADREIEGKLFVATSWQLVATSVVSGLPLLAPLSRVRDGWIGDGRNISGGISQRCRRPGMFSASTMTLSRPLSAVVSMSQ